MLGLGAPRAAGRTRGRAPAVAAGVSADCARSEALDDARQAVRLAAADDPLEQAPVAVRHVERRVARADRGRRVGQPQQVAVRHALALAVLHRLVGERVDRLCRVPAADAPTERPAPAAEALDELREPEQVRAGSRDARQGVQRPPRLDVAETGRHREREQRRVVLRRRPRR